MRISDWSSDVCSSDLRCRPGAAAPVIATARPAAGDGNGMSVIDLGHEHGLTLRQVEIMHGARRILGTVSLGVPTGEVVTVMGPRDRKGTRLNHSHECEHRTTSHA